MGDRLKAQDRRKRNEVEVEMPDGTNVLCRKHDMTALVFEGRVPMPMLMAVQKMIEMPNASAAERVAALGEENGKSLMDVLRKHACDVSIDPKIVMEESTDLTVIPVGYLEIAELMRIWVETAVVPQVEPAAAARFRSGPGADDAPPAPAVVDVPSAAEQLDSDRPVEVVTG